MPLFNLILMGVTKCIVFETQIKDQSKTALVSNLGKFVPGGRLGLVLEVFLHPIIYPKHPLNIQTPNPQSKFTTKSATSKH